MKITITVRTINDHTIEYDVAAQEPWDAEAETRTYHANRSATFHGPHTGNGNAQQVRGPADTPWRNNKRDMVYEFKKRYPGARVHFQ